MIKRYSVFVLVIVALITVWVIPVSAQDGLADKVTATYEALLDAEPVYDVVEQVIEFENEGGTVVGTLTVPDGAEKPYPIALLLHGFTGTRDELPITGTEEGMYSRTARLFAEQGIASLRIDFRGSGESDGEWADTTFSGQISDAHAALDYVATLDDIDADRIALVGLSQGGLVAAATAARDARVQTTVLWSPVAHPPDTYSLIVGADNVAAGLASGGEPIEITLPWGAVIELKTPFFEDLYAIDPVAEITSYSGPLMVVVGGRDDTVYPQPYYGQLYMNYHYEDDSEMLVVLDGDHVFDVLTEAGPVVLDDAAYWSLAWIIETLP